MKESRMYSHSFPNNPHKVQWYWSHATRSPHKHTYILALNAIISSFTNCIIFWGWLRQTNLKIIILYKLKISILAGLFLPLSVMYLGFLLFSKFLWDSLFECSGLAGNMPTFVHQSWKPDWLQKYRVLTQKAEVTPVWASRAAPQEKVCKAQQWVPRMQHPRYIRFGSVYSDISFCGPNAR